MLTFTLYYSLTVKQKKSVVIVCTAVHRLAPVLVAALLNDSNSPLILLDHSLSDGFEMIRLWAIIHVICGSCHLFLNPDIIVLVLG